MGLGWEKREKKVSVEIPLEVNVSISRAASATF